MDKFEYPLIQRLIRVSYLIAAFIVVLIILAISLATIIIKFTNYSLPSGIKIPENLSILLLNILAIGLFSGIFLMNHLMFPAICVEGNGFRIKTEIYKSRVFAWEEIRWVKEHRLSRRRRKIIGLHIKEMNLIFYLMGLFQLYNASVFFINSRIKNFEGLLEILHNERPELFESSSNFSVKE